MHSPLPARSWLLYGLLVLCSLLIAAPARTAEGKKWALLVGVNVYDHPHISPLNFAVADARALSEALRRDAGFAPERITLLTSDQDRRSRPTRDNVLDALSALATKTGPDDTLLLYFSGHGFSKGEGANFLATMNADPDDLDNTAVPLKLLQERLRAVKAQHVVFVIDACRNSPSRSLDGGDNLLTPALARDLKRVAAAGDQIRGRAVLMACSEGQRAYEWLEKNQGVFTYFLLERLAEARSRGLALTINDLADHAQRKTLAWSRQKFAGSSIAQKPDFELTGAPVIPLLEAAQRPTPMEEAVPIPAPRPGSVYLADFPAGLRPTFPGETGKVELRGKAHPKSFWLAGGGEAVFVLQGKYSAFTATVGVNDLTDSRDSQMVFQVFGDDPRAALYTSPAMKAGDRPHLISVNVQGQQQVRLRVVPLGGGIPASHAWWGDARVERGGVTPPKSDVVYLAGMAAASFPGELGSPELRSRRFERSFWLAGEGEAVYQIKSRFDRFSATVGVRDDTDSPRQTVMFQVFGDDDQAALYTSPEMKAGDIPHDIVINVEGQQELRVKVVPIDGGLPANHAWWGDARLEKGDPPPPSPDTYVVDMSPVTASGESGSPLIRGRRFDRSRWIAGGGEETYLLGGKYERFVAAAGIADTTDSPDCTVSFQLLDGDRVLFASGPQKVGKGPVRVEADVRGVQRLTLKCVSEAGIPARHAWWGDARLVKTR